MKIKFYDASVIYKEIYEREKSALTAHAEAAEPCETTALFERDMARYLEAEKTIACASYENACDALFSALLSAGDTVVATVFCKCREAIERCGAEIVFADTEPVTFNISAAAVLSAVTEKTRAVVVTDMAGQTGEYEKLAEVLKDKNIYLIEEATEALCSHRICGDKICRAGSFCDAGLISFAPGADFAAEEEYGLIVLPKAHEYDKGVAEKAAEPDHEQSALLRARLRSCEEWAENRRVLAERYMFMLGENALYRRITPSSEAEYNRHVYNSYTLLAENRDGLYRYLAEHGVETVRPEIQLSPEASEKLPASSAYIKNAISLPIYKGLTAVQQEKIISLIADFYKES